jgi:CheY-like chemotaxis protein
VCVPFTPVPAETNFAADENNLKASPNRVPDDIKPEGTKLRDDLRLSVLVVDDVFINIEVATMILESLGCQTDRAMSGQEAIDAVKNKSYDIIYMDRQMPEMDGIEATQRIRKISGSETVPWIVALTASAQEDQKEEYLQAGANDFLSKPIDVDSVSRSVENYKKIKLS